MDFRTCDMLIHGGEYDHSDGSFNYEAAAGDIRLVFENCKQFNHENSDFWQKADELLTLFEKYYQRWIIRPLIHDDDREGPTEVRDTLGNIWTFLLRFRSNLWLL